MSVAISSTGKRRRRYRRNHRGRSPAAHGLPLACRVRVIAGACR